MDVVKITPHSHLPPLPQLGQLVQLFLNAKNVDLSDIQNDLLSKILLKSRQNTCFVGHVYNLKNSLMFKLLAFWRKYTPFIDQKALMKRRQKICAGPPPLVWTKSKRTAAFFRDPFPYVMAAYGRKSAVRTKPELDVTFLVTFGTLFR